MYLYVELLTPCSLYSVSFRKWERTVNRNWRWELRWEWEWCGKKPVNWIGNGIGGNGNLELIRLLSWSSI